jgi:hypothetical protein
VTRIPAIRLSCGEPTQFYRGSQFQAELELQEQTAFRSSIRVCGW